MWSDKVNVDIGVDEDNLIQLTQWVSASCDSVNRKRATAALKAQESLAAVYDEYEDIAHPIFVGVDIPKRQMFFMRRSAKGGYYITADQPVSFL